MAMATRGGSAVVWSKQINDFPYLKGMSVIFLSWVISPISAGIVVAILFGSLKYFILRSRHSFSRGLNVRAYEIEWVFNESLKNMISTVSAIHFSSMSRIIFSLLIVGKETYSTHMNHLLIISSSSASMRFIFYSNLAFSCPLPTPPDPAHLRDLHIFHHYHICHPNGRQEQELA